MDEALLEFASRLGSPVLRQYGWVEPAATFGYSQRYAEVASWTRLRPLIRRPTGGGLVPHDADWTYSLVFPPDHPWYALTAWDSYQRAHEWIGAAFCSVGLATQLARAEQKTGPGQCFAGPERFDVLWRGKKIAGAAQRRNRFGLLIQGSVQARDLPVSRRAWADAMEKNIPWQEKICWVPLFSTISQELREALKRRARELAEGKYSSAAHNERR